MRPTLRSCDRVRESNENSFCKSSGEGGEGLQGDDEAKSLQALHYVALDRLARMLVTVLRRGGAVGLVACEIQHILSYSDFSFRSSHESM
jgi:hypothetical protein